VKKKKKNKTFKYQSTHVRDILQNVEVSCA